MIVSHTWLQLKKMRGVPLHFRSKTFAMVTGGKGASFLVHECLQVVGFTLSQMVQAPGPQS